MQMYRLVLHSPSSTFLGVLTLSLSHTHRYFTSQVLYYPLCELTVFVEINFIVSYEKKRFFELLLLPGS
jgi:hypothetical protein